MNAADKIKKYRTFRGYKVRFGKRLPALDGTMTDERWVVSYDDNVRHAGRNVVVINGSRFVVTLV